MTEDYGRFTPYGFTWGPAEVSRISRLNVGDRDSRVIGIKTPYKDIEVYVSKTGRSVRIFDRTSGKELK